MKKRALLTKIPIPTRRITNSFKKRGWGAYGRPVCILGESIGMSEKTYIPGGEQPPQSQIGATMEALARTIAERRNAGDESYTCRLLSGSEDAVLKKVMEEAGEVALAAKDGEPDHLRYEAADVVYHLMVVLERYRIPLD
jgi:phosphoribosyl-ATP pyrophosphohydrolase